MKNKKALGAVLIGFFLLLLLLILVTVIWVFPPNMGPIEPFLNLGDLALADLFSGDQSRAGGGELPGKPAYYQTVPDCSTGDLAQPGELFQPAPGCDSWEANRFERPFNAVSQDQYFPDLDIQYAFLGRDAGWYYLRLALFDPLPGAEFLDGAYALEMDLDLDGRGDLLVLVSEPGKEKGKEWSTGGVQIWADSNNDVGGEEPGLPESAAAADGYETLLFDQGGGGDPSGAWARTFLGGSAYVELAFKDDYLEGDLAFKWWVWSGYGNSPDQFDLHDFYSREQAGAANQELDFFPVREVSAVDNSCAGMWGASPDPADPDYCQEGVSLPDYKYNTCVMLKCAIPLLPCKIPPGKPGDDPCVLNFEDWLYSIWKPAHPGQELPAEGELWDQYGAYLKDPFCPPEGLVTPSFTPTPTSTPTLTPTLPPTPTETPTPRSPVCNHDCGCEPEQGETADNCPSDCPQHCGNGVCDCAETFATCPDDCRPECKRDLAEDECKKAGGTWTFSALGGYYCDCP